MVALTELNRLIRAMARGSFTKSTPSTSTTVVLEPVVEASGAQAEGGDHPVASHLLLHSGDHTLLDQIDHAIVKQFGMDAQVTVTA